VRLEESVDVHATGVRRMRNSMFLGRGDVVARFVILPS